MSLIFIGDIMGHDSQIKAAYYNDTKSYNYDEVFSKVAPIIKKADFAIANLEVTLAGKPYTGYPQFCSPDELASACKKSGIDVLVTANNHSCDKGLKGVVRTIDVLDDLELKHTGTFKDITERNKRNLITLEKDGIKIGLLNYTYGTNYIPTPLPTQVNRIDKQVMAKDIKNAKSKSLDKLIVMIHWGKEYQHYPSTKQKETANFLFSQGVDYIVGAHPHVLQPMTHIEKTPNTKEKFIAYSLGNFVSNQRTRGRDGAAMLHLALSKQDNEVKIEKASYILTWVNKPIINGVTRFEILPCSLIEKKNFENISSIMKVRAKTFIKDSRALLEKENLNVTEQIIKY